MKNLKIENKKNVHREYILKPLRLRFGEVFKFAIRVIRLAKKEVFFMEIFDNVR